ncbi:ABC transporter substrate-binding protein [Pelagibacterium xiamenense]|uniref:ABC transporter substrate-binding protein n=1 Tax=Pelagibacterium xiamenense TaxID=2901140 RepID=UPI001E5A5D11|nr:sugar ABC transporter substrate-binding protein [Pelagibacterium xiamenense]MCD7060589.1 sugar ABC transporter substrate-binding protein [Pelagibacterium xiamenense]
MGLPRLLKAPLGAASVVALMTSSVFAQDLTMWVRESAADPGQLMVDLWNSTHDAQIELTAIPDNQLVTKLATSVRAGEAPDLISFDLIYMPDFMRAGFLTDLTDQLQSDPNYETHIQAYKDIATYEDRIYGVGFTPDVSILVWNKELFREAGLDPEDPPETIYEIHEMATQIGALDDDTYGFYFAGSCPGCNIFVTSPIMVAGGAEILPRNGEDAALEGEAIHEVLDQYRQMWEEGLIPESAEVDAGENFVSAFTTGNIGITGSGGFLLSLMERQFPDFDYGVTLLPGLEPGQVSGFVGGDVVAIPEGSPNEETAREFVSWVLSDEAQLEGLAKNSILTTRTDLADNEYFQGNEKVQATAQALEAGYVPWVFHFATMVNSDSSPWINMIQRAVFDGEVESAIEDARARMLEIASQ